MDWLIITGDLPSGLGGDPFIEQSLALNDVEQLNRFFFSYKDSFPCSTVSVMLALVPIRVATVTVIV